MHASCESLTNEVDVDPTLVMCGLGFDEDENENVDSDDEAPTRHHLAPSELLSEPPVTFAAVVLPPAVGVSADGSSADGSVADARPVFALELLPARPSVPAIAAKALLRWAPWAALGATGGLAICIAITAIVGPAQAEEHAHHVVPSSPASSHVAAVTAARVPAVEDTTNAGEIIELDDGRAPRTSARRTRASAPAAARVNVNATSAPRMPPLAAMPPQYKTR